MQHARVRAQNLKNDRSRSSFFKAEMGESFQEAWNSLSKIPSDSA
jgi:hypothetical protein